VWPKGPLESASYQQGGVLLSRESLALILFLVTLSELLLLRRILILRTPVNKPEIKAGLWRWTSLGLLVPGKYGGIENDPDRQS
jgi:hypothetical protein